MYNLKAPDKNSVTFTWFNQYSGVMIRTQTKTLLIDPTEIKAKSIQNVDAILLTHEHYDHFDQRLVSDIQKATNCKVIADPGTAKRLQLAIPADKIVAVKPGGEVKLDQVSIRAEKSNHTAEAPVTFVITSEDDVKIFHTSDSLPFPEMALMSQKEKFDIRD